MFWLLVHFVLYGPAGFRDETLAAFADQHRDYHLVELDGEPNSVTAILRFPEMWQLEAHTPCFLHRAKITIPYPWFGFGGLTSLELGCVHTEFEVKFLTGLRQSKLSEVQGGILILTSDDGSEMVFRTKP